jgi:hypothetical protein
MCMPTDQSSVDFSKSLNQARIIPKLADPDSCCRRPTGTSIATEVQWDIDAALGADDGADESSSPQVGIMPHNSRNIGGAH